ncbi:6687_t:CDS:1, partial [Acaulospora colombiana]
MSRVSFHPLPAVSRPNPLASDSWRIHAPRRETNSKPTETQPLFREAPLIFPIEIWVLILDILLEPLKRPYLHCTADTVALYQSRLYRLCNTDLGIWFRVRSVCRTWMRIVDQCPHMTFRTKWDGRLSSLEGVTSIFMDWSDAESAIFLHQLENLPDVTSSLTTLEFSEGWIVEEESPVQFLLEGGLQLPRLQCLSLSVNYRPSEGTRIWNGIQKKFPNLVSLTLRNEIVQPDTIELMRLEILDFWSSPTLSGGVTTYNLPSLKHLSIRGGRSACNTLFRTHGSQLESLFIFEKIDHKSVWKEEGEALWC